MAIIAITTQGQRDYLERHDVGEKLSRKAEELHDLKIRVGQKAQIVALEGVKVRAGLVDKISALDALLEAELTNWDYQYNENGDVINVLTNADADNSKGWT